MRNKKIIDGLIKKLVKLINEEVDCFIADRPYLEDKSIEHPVIKSDHNEKIKQIQFEEGQVMYELQKICKGVGEAI